MKLKNFIKENLIIIRIIIITLILMGVIVTYTYSFFAVTQTNSNIIAGTAENLSVTVDVSKVAPSGNGKLIPQLDSAITSAITGRNGSCIDDNNNTVCHTYKITAKNNGSTVTSLNGTVTINKKNNPNLKWARYSPGTTPTLVGSVKETSNVELTTNDEFTAGQTKEYYIVVWISELGHGQIDTGNYAGIVEFKTFDLVLPIEYEYYYSTLASAVNDINANTVGTNAISNKNSAVAGIYTLNDGTYSAVLLKDSVETTTVSPTVDMTINLGGHTFIGNATIVIDITAGNVIIDGRIPGSTVEVNYNGTSTYRTIAVRGTGGVTILGGTYKNLRTTSNALNIVIASQTTSYINIQDATIIATSPDYYTYGVNNQGGNLTISNCDINVISDNGVGVGVRNSNNSKTVISTSRISSYGNFDSSIQGYGIQSEAEATLTLNDCYVMGTFSGVYNKGHLYVNGGIYEGYRNGGFYLYNSEKETYISNSIIRTTDMPNGYEDLMESGALRSFLVGTNSNITVYMDNCDIYGSERPFSITASNNKLYISNSTINLDSEKGILIEYATDKLYIGAGNNFTINNVDYAPEGAENSVITTNETYVRPNQ